MPATTAADTAQLAGQPPPAVAFHDVFIPVMTSQPFTGAGGQPCAASPRAVQSAKLTAQMAVETAQVAVETAVLLQQRMCGTPPEPAEGASSCIDVALDHDGYAFEPHQQLQVEQQYASSGAEGRPRRNSCMAAFGSSNGLPSYQPWQALPRLDVDSSGGVNQLPSWRSSYGVTSKLEQQQFPRQIQRMQAAAVMSAATQSGCSSAGALPANLPDPWRLPQRQQQFRKQLMYTRATPRRSSYCIASHRTPEQQVQQWRSSHPRRNSWSAYAGAPFSHQLGSCGCCAVSDVLPAPRRPSFAASSTTPLPGPAPWHGLKHASSSNCISTAALAGNQGYTSAMYLPPLWANGCMLGLLPEEGAHLSSAACGQAMPAAAASFPTARLHEAACTAGADAAADGAVPHAMNNIEPEQLLQASGLPATLPEDTPLTPDVQRHLQQLIAMDEEDAASMFATDCIASWFTAEYDGQRRTLQQQQQYMQQAGLSNLSVMRQRLEQEPWHPNHWKQQQQQHQMSESAGESGWSAGSTTAMGCTRDMLAFSNGTGSSGRNSFSMQVSPEQNALMVQQQQQQALRCRRGSGSGGGSCVTPASSSGPSQLTVRTKPGRECSSSSSMHYCASKQAPAAATAPTAAVAGIDLGSGAGVFRTIQQELQHLQQLQSRLAAAAAAAAGTPVAAACAAALQMHEDAMHQAVATKAAIGAVLGMPPDARSGGCSNASPSMDGFCGQLQQPYQASAM